MSDDSAAETDTDFVVVEHMNVVEMDGSPFQRRVKQGPRKTGFATVEVFEDGSFVTSFDGPTLTMVHAVQVLLHDVMLQGAHPE